MADNGKEFDNALMFNLCRKYGIQIKFGPPYSPYANGLNERNHASCDITVRKLRYKNKKLSLQDASHILGKIYVKDN